MPRTPSREVGWTVRINGPAHQRGHGGVWWQQPATCLRKGMFRNVAGMKGAPVGAGVMWG